MSTTPTAAELHTLVNGEFTMPDGAKRRALWERVPETQWGHATGGLFNLSNGEQCPAGWWFNMLHIPDDMAAALIRVAIEEWIKDGPGHRFIVKHTRDPEHRVWIDDLDAFLTKSRSDITIAYSHADTLIEALVACAHQVADAMGIAH